MFLLYFDQSKSCSFAHKLLIITITFNPSQNILYITRERERERESERDTERDRYSLFEKEFCVVSRSCKTGN